ncbi:MAG: DNA-binding protein [Acidilobaceae archaeon]
MSDIEYTDEELEAIRSRKLAEIQRRLEEERRRKEIEMQREELLRSILTSEARSRLANLRLVKPELTRTIEDYIIQLVNSGRLAPPIREDVIKRILIELDEKTRRDYKITFKRK